MPTRRRALLTLIAAALAAPAFTAGLHAQDKNEPKGKKDYKLTIYDDEHLKGKFVVVRGQVPDMNTLRFAGRSESISWNLPPGQAAVLCDEKNFQKPVLILVGTGKVEDLGKEQPNALHSISSVSLVKFPKGGKPTGPLKDVPIVGTVEE